MTGLNFIKSYKILWIIFQKYPLIYLQNPIIFSRVQKRSDVHNIVKYGVIRYANVFNIYQSSAHGFPKSLLLCPETTEAREKSKTFFSPKTISKLLLFQYTTG